MNLLTISRPLFILVFAISAFLVMVILSVIIQISGLHLPEKELEEKTFWFIFMAVVVAPIIETWIFQKIPIDFFKDRFQKDWPPVLISAIPFGLMHYMANHMFRDILYASGIGAVFAWAYIVAGRRDDLNPYSAVVFIHAGYNLIIILAQALFLPT